MGVSFNKNNCIFVLSSIVMVGLQNVVVALAPFRDTDAILYETNVREKRQASNEYNYALGFHCYNCSGTLADCGRARVSEDDSVQCLEGDSCFLSRQTKASGGVEYHRYCDEPIHYLACSQTSGFACELYQGDWWCDECCNSHLCNSMQWTYGITTAEPNNSSTSYSDSIPTQTEQATITSDSTYASTTTFSTVKTSFESSPHSSTSPAPHSSTSPAPHSSTSPSPQSTTKVSPKSWTSTSQGSPTSPSVSPSVSSKSTLPETSTSASLPSTGTTTKLTQTTRAPLSGRLSCFKCTGDLIHCGLSRDPNSEKETCGELDSQCFVQWDVQGSVADYKRGCLSSSMVDFDVKTLCPPGILRGCKDNVCAMCCGTYLCNDVLWFYSSAPSQQVKFMHWIWFLCLIVIIEYIFE